MAKCWCNLILYCLSKWSFSYSDKFSSRLQIFIFSLFSIQLYYGCNCIVFKPATSIRSESTECHKRQWLLFEQNAFIMPYGISSTESLNMQTFFLNLFVFKTKYLITINILCLFWMQNIVCKFRFNLLYVESSDFKHIHGVLLLFFFGGGCKHAESI